MEKADRIATCYTRDSSEELYTCTQVMDWLASDPVDFCQTDEDVSAGRIASDLSCESIASWPHQCTLMIGTNTGDGKKSKVSMFFSDSASADVDAESYCYEHGGSEYK